MNVGVIHGSIDTLSWSTSTLANMFPIIIEAIGWLAAPLYKLIGFGVLGPIAGKHALFPVMRTPVKGMLMFYRQPRHVVSVRLRCNRHLQLLPKCSNGWLRSSDCWKYRTGWGGCGRIRFLAHRERYPVLMSGGHS